MKYFLQKFLQKLFLIERDPKKLACSTCLGLFIAFSPFLGLQTPLVFIVGYICRLPIPVIFSVVYLVNNPFLTTIPIIIANYATGYLLFTYILPLDLCPYNPSWFKWIEKKIAPSIHYYLGLNDICFWYFIVGGILCAILMSVPFYPLLKRFFTKISHENYSAE